MIEGVLTRTEENKSFTRGRLFIDKIGFFHTLELPWVDNKRGISCIPYGTYQLVPHGWGENTKLTKKKCWQLLEVPNRYGVLIHSGNWVNQIKGCILIGMSAGILNNKPAVISSMPAMDILRAKIGQTPWTLTIKPSEGVRNA